MLLTNVLTPDKPACAQESVTDCIDSLISRGVSPDKAAEACSELQKNGGSVTTAGPSEECIKNKMTVYYTATAESGPTEDKRWSYRDDAAPESVFKEATCERKVKSKGFIGIGRTYRWLCQKDSLTYVAEQRSRNHAKVLCAGGEACIAQQSSTVEETQLTGQYQPDSGKWLYGNPPEISYSQMSAQGCSRTTVDYVQQWVCGTPTVKLKVTRSTGISLDGAIRQCANQIGVRLDQ